jgi:uncharacterized protein (TIGR04255 family)
MAQPYKRPPVTEALIEIRLESPIEGDLLDGIKTELVKEYPLASRTVAVNLEVNLQLMETAPKVLQQAQGYRLTALDGASLVTIAPNSLATSRLAPYEGWEPFNASARRNWAIWRKVAGWRKVARLGVRYVNRIDVPGDNVQISDYSCFSLTVPSLGLPAMASFAINASMPLGKDDCGLILNSGSTASPLVKTTSFILDIDISRETGLPQNEDDLWQLADRIRVHKNAVFEACVTDRARELFNK